MKKIFSALFVAALIIMSVVPAFAEDKYENISLGVAEDGTVLSENEVLSPYKNYEFIIYLNKNGEKIPVSNSMGDNLKITASILNGRDSISECKILRGRENYYLKLRILPLSYVKQNNAQIRLTINGDNISLTRDFAFKTGFKSVSDDYINNLQKGEAIRINNDRPLFTASQLKRISEINGGNDVTFKGENFTYKVNLRGTPSSNMYYTDNVIDEIDNANHNANLKFLTFPAGPQFSKSELVIDVSDLEHFNGKFHFYSYYKNKLTEIPAKYDKETLTLSMDITGLGTFVISDTPLTKTVTTVVKPSNNPNTGVDDLGSTAVLGLISALSGILVIKRKLSCK